MDEIHSITFVIHATADDLSRFAPFYFHLRKKQQGHIRLQALRNQDGQLHFPLLTIMLRLKLITAHLLSADYMPIESAPMLYIFNVADA